MKSTLPDYPALHADRTPQPENDPLLIAILAAALGLALLVTGIVVFWGSGPALVEIPWYIPMVNTFGALTSLCVAFLAFGRCQVLRNSVSFWVGIGFATLGIGQLFYVLTWPGLMPDGGAIIARLPNTSAFIANLNLTILGGFLLAAALVRWPGDRVWVSRRWLGAVAAWLFFVTLAFIILVSIEQYLPSIMRTDQTYTPLIQFWAAFLLLLFAAGTFLSTRHYLRSGDALSGYVAFAQMALVFIVMMMIIGGKRFDLWWYLQRVILVLGNLAVLFGLLSDYVRLLRHENEARRMFDAMMENIPVGLAVTGGPPDFLLSRVSRYGLDMNQRPVEGLVGAPAGQHQDAWKLFLADGMTQPQPEQMPLYRAIHFGEEVCNLELVMETLEGRKIPVLVNAAPIRDEQGQITAAINTWLDISERKRAEEALLWSENKFQSIYQNSPFAIALSDVSDGTYLDVNDAWLKMTGCEKEEVIGKTSLELGLILDPQERKEIFDCLQKQGMVRNFEIRARNKTGDVLVLSTNINIVMILEKKYLLSVMENVTERKQAEETLAEAARKLERSNRDLMNFTAVASHDLQEPLRKIEALGDAVLEGAAKDGAANIEERQRDRILRMRKSAQEMRDMVNGLLQLSLLSTGALSFQPVDLGQITAQLLFELDERLHQSGGIVQVSQLPIIQADPLQMRWLLQHLIENALKFQLPDGKARVQVSSTQPTPALAQILVEDNGIGFDEAHAGHLFNPFERLVGKNQSTYRGTGMGLAICRWIVEHHSGEITARSKPGQGTTIIITLPVYQANGYLQGDRRQQTDAHPQEGRFNE